MTDLQLADAIARHRGLTGGTQEAACLALGISRGRGSRIKAMFTKVPPEALDLEHRPRARYALSKLHKLNDPALVIDLARKAHDLPMAVESVEEAVQKLLGTGKQEKIKTLKLRIGTARMEVSNPTLDSIEACAERLLAGVKKLRKDGDGIEFLPARLKG
jgi:hypothetical protein